MYLGPYVQHHLRGRHTSSLVEHAWREVVVIERLATWIKRHQVTAFFIVTSAITWGLGFSYGAVEQGLFLQAPLTSVATCGPALAGIIISAVANTEPRPGRAGTAWVAFIMRTAFSRIQAAKSHMASLTRLRGVWGWALLALVMVPGLFLLSIPLSNGIGRRPIPAFPFTAPELPLTVTISVLFLFQFFFTNTTGEEPGRRGFAVPRLQARTSPLIASLALTFLWTA